MNIPKRLEVAFYQSDKGKMPVKEWLKALPPADRKTIGEDIRTVQYGWPVGMPVVRPIKNVRKLWEVRSGLSDGTIVRIFFTIWQEYMVLLHGFIKKTQKTPKKELELARKRMAKFIDKGIV